MTESEWTAKWENGLGERAYQPRLPDGRVLWWKGVYTLWRKDRPGHSRPELLDDRDEAEAKARAHHMEELEHDWRPVSE